MRINHRLKWIARQFYKPHRTCWKYSVGFALAIGCCVWSFQVQEEWQQLALIAMYIGLYFWGHNGLFYTSLKRAKVMNRYRHLGRRQLRLFPERWWGIYCDGQQFGVVRAWTESKALEDGLNIIKRNWNPNATIDRVSVRKST